MSRREETLQGEVRTSADRIGLVCGRRNLKRKNWLEGIGNKKINSIYFACTGFFNGFREENSDLYCYLAIIHIGLRNEAIVKVMCMWAKNTFPLRIGGSIIEVKPQNKFTESEEQVELLL